jgi:dTMP kinase
MGDTTEASPARGPFIVLEGIDGSGTTTQLHALRDHFQRTGRRAFFTHEPSLGPAGMLARLALQKRLVGAAFELHDPADTARPASPDFDPVALALLFAADRADHVATQLRPNLDAGRVVVCDRYLLSTLAYQGQTCDVEWLLEINRPAVRPDLTSSWTFRPPPRWSGCAGRAGTRSCSRRPRSSGRSARTTSATSIVRSRRWGRWR